MPPAFRPSASEADRAKLYTSMAELERQGRLSQSQLSNLAAVRLLRSEPSPAVVLAASISSAANAKSSLSFASGYER